MYFEKGVIGLYIYAYWEKSYFLRFIVTSEKKAHFYLNDIKYLNYLENRSRSYKTVVKSGIILLPSSWIIMTARETRVIWWNYYRMKFGQLKSRVSYFLRLPSHFFLLTHTCLNRNFWSARPRTTFQYVTVCSLVSVPWRVW